MTKIKIQNCYGEYTVAVDRDDMPLDMYMRDLIIPCLLAAGFSQQTIDRFVEGENV